jgi:hypothetical protein
MYDTIHCYIIIQISIFKDVVLITLAATFLLW